MWFCISFSFLLAVKMFHWLFKDRAELIEQTAQYQKSTVCRLFSVFFVLFCIDLYQLVMSIMKIKESGPSISILLGTEYALMFIYLLHHSVKLCLNLYDLRDAENAWEEKSAFVFYLELATDFIKLVIYVSFFALVTKYYGLPIHIIRDLYFTLKSFANRIRDLIRYKQAIYNLEKKYPDCTEEELASSDRTCIICRDEINAGGKKLPCGHLFHLGCLKSWIERQQTCPTCRRAIFEEEPKSPSPAQPILPENIPLPETPLQEEFPDSSSGFNQQETPNYVFSLPENTTNTQEMLPIVLLPGEGKIGIWTNEQEPETSSTEEQFINEIEEKIKSIMEDLQKYKLKRQFLQKTAQ